MTLLAPLIRAIGKKLNKENPRLLFNVLIAFLATFTIAHLYSLFVPIYVFIAGYHIHHFYYGMVLLAIAAIALMLTNQDKVRHFMSYVIGIGIGLIVDELGLLLSCTGERIDVFCRYVFPSNFDAVAIVAVIILIFIMFGDRPVRWFLPKSWQNSRQLNRDVGYDMKKIGEKIKKELKKKHQK